MSKEFQKLIQKIYEKMKLMEDTFLNEFLENDLHLLNVLFHQLEVLIESTTNEAKYIPITSDLKQKSHLEKAPSSNEENRLETNSSITQNLRAKIQSDRQTIISEKDLYEINKILSIRDHLLPGMKLSHFVNYLVPIERWLGRRVKDSDFLITNTDRTQGTPANSSKTFENSNQTPKNPLILIAENIRSAFNIGSFFRLADCLNAQAIFSCGYTLDAQSEMIQKTALGAEKQVFSKHFSTTLEAINECRSLGFKVYALETCDQASSLFQVQLNGPTAFVVGNERFGLEASLLAQCDGVISIPTYGFKNSLNVANALAIASYEWMRQNQPQNSSQNFPKNICLENSSTK